MKLLRRLRGTIYGRRSRLFSRPSTKLHPIILRCYSEPFQLDMANIPQEDKEEMKFVMAQSKKNIDAWKSHILRYINQDEARLDIIKALDNTSVLVVLDWAMKFIPRKYRESQADWFGKRGLSWHISVAMKKTPAESLQTVTLVHMFQKSNQRQLVCVGHHGRCHWEIEDCNTRVYVAGHMQTIRNQHFIYQAEKEETLHWPFARIGEIMYLSSLAFLCTAVIWHNLVTCWWKRR